MYSRKIQVCIGSIQFLGRIVMWHTKIVIICEYNKQHNTSFARISSSSWSSSLSPHYIASKCCCGSVMGEFSFRPRICQPFSMPSPSYHHHRSRTTPKLNVFFYVNYRNLKHCRGNLWWLKIAHHHYDVVHVYVIRYGLDVVSNDGLARNMSCCATIARWLLQVGAWEVHCDYRHR